MNENSFHVCRYFFPIVLHSAIYCFVTFRLGCGPSRYVTSTLSNKSFSSERVYSNRLSATDDDTAIAVTV